MRPAIMVCLLLLLLPGAVAAVESDRVPPLRVLHADGDAAVAGAGHHGSAPSEWKSGACARSRMHVVDLVPGRYTLGLSYPRAIPPLRVSLYDRWPYARGAHRVDLPLGPRLAAARLEYRWPLGIAANSTGVSLFVLIATSRCDRPVPYRLFVLADASAPTSSMAHGITFLPGPRRLVLGNAAVPANTGIEEFAMESSEEVRASLQRQPVPGDLIRNGWFAAGLSDWSVGSDGGSFDVRDGELRLMGSGHRVTLSQAIDADVTGAAGLVLRTEVRLDADSAVGTDAPLVIALCYDDSQGGTHCGSEAYRIAFAAGAVAAPRGTHYLPAGRWYRYVANLAQLKPAPRKIRSIELESDMAAGSMARLRDLHLTRMEGSP